MQNEVKNRIELILGDDEQLKPKYQMYHECHLQALKCILKKGKREQEQGNSDIIAFIGERGTGKTTAMNAFCNILDQVMKQADEWVKRNSFQDYIKLDSEEKLGFCILPTIDASLLEDKEDLFELILASMFQEYEKKLLQNPHLGEQTWISKRQEASREFGEVYRNHRNVKHIERNEDLGESVISKLRALPSSLKTQTAFDELLSKFFSAILGNQYPKKYLVVVIDDLDLNVEHGFEMLEQIHKYLAHPQVIILATFSYEQLLMITENHFRKSFNVMTKSKYLEDDKHDEVHCRKLARDYLDKMIPADKRIYMPDILKNYRTANIKTAIKDEKDDKPKMVEAKKYLFKKIGERLSIYYDGKGKKRHFSEGTTVRKLMSYLHLLDSLTPISFSKCKIRKGECNESTNEEEKKQKEDQTALLKQYNANQEVFYTDIIGRMIYEQTDNDQCEFIKSVLDVDVSQQAKQLVNLGRMRYNEEASAVDVDLAKYSYCDLVRCIYNWGRIVFEDKPIIHCMMAAFTSQMVREYVNYMYGVEKEKCEKSCFRLNEFIGDTFGNKWTLKMLGTQWSDDAFPNKEYEKVPICYVKDLELTMYNLKFSLGLTKELHTQLEFDKSERCEAIVDYMVNQLEADKVLATLECLRMLLANCRNIKTHNDELSYAFQVKKISLDSQEKIVLQCVFETDNADFDIFGFVKKSIAPQKVHFDFAKLTIDKLVDALVCFLIEESQGTINTNEEELIRQGLRNRLIELSIFANEQSECDNIAFPFYNFDLSYNIIKRVRKRCKEEMSEAVPQLEIATSIVQVYQFIEEELKEQAKFYNESGEKSYFIYDEIFATYPYIRAMRDLVNNEKFKRTITRILKSTTSLRREEEEIKD